MDCIRHGRYENDGAMQSIKRERDAIMYLAVVQPVAWIDTCCECTTAATTSEHSAASQ